MRFTVFNFIETDNGIKKTDLFFSNCINLNSHDGTKYKLPISSELQNAINRCKYIILQDTLLNNIKSDKRLVHQRNIFSSKSFRMQKIRQRQSQNEVSLVNNKKNGGL